MGVHIKDPLMKMPCQPNLEKTVLAILPKRQALMQPQHEIHYYNKGKIRQNSITLFIFFNLKKGRMSGKQASLFLRQPSHYSVFEKWTTLVNLFFQKDDVKELSHSFSCASVNNVGCKMIPQFFFLNEFLHLLT